VTIASCAKRSGRCGEPRHPIVASPIARHQAVTNVKAIVGT
jgi:hypothetical protein